jgi:hypothetical protein
MRRFTDREGNDWDVVLGRESWGTSLALFVPRNDAVPVRQANLSAESVDAATQELDALADHALQELLDRSRIKE